ncbi:chloramphenicol acetyltransferase [Alkalihalobacillus alcalophilus ATCC 27647 = CGMCC 1.3604]|uniref:Chloramphenicol acetyltransferase n=1 Tax=Alkalihalobacillus alcalophilus ATCC 27647 = CGMCC 1.3604 TaxID=1218173 RepID=A0A094WDW9_ALKAL|nr:type A chloramphenicol O-acetyltransferase [Alkalihalobacillus alcalophilus]KGA95949.1 chloramphenicol acetyltransferase [Alkalihalobacillus alcalophilus ATCC 27647 = CGMCC 1.3604]MED1561767.1 type A chloramphenicol O-acetyltransferase [Alkalihalobacillus alcalophilus]THG89091.1 chloramphenicol acetyltransferase [Alkalihalobacillus alcalophilus ATCC 27647 = CGMCC 1.3604]
MKFTIIDRKNWHRKEYFEHYLHQQTTFSITTEMDISVLMKTLKKKNYKLYPAFIFMVTRIVNSYREFRTNFNSEGELGFWTELFPTYTVFDKETSTFSSIWSPNLRSFADFYVQYEKDIKCYNGKGVLFPKTPVPENGIPISMIPWTTFTGFNLNINNGGDFLLPIITGGKYYQTETGLFLPVSLQVHHAVCDGYHASLFMNELQELADHCAEWI